MADIAQFLASLFSSGRVGQLSGQYGDFRRSDNIEDRRRTQFHPVPGVFGNGIDMGNVFDNGLLTGLKPTDFATAGTEVPTVLSIDAGVKDIKSGEGASPDAVVEALRRIWGL